MPAGKTSTIPLHSLVRVHDVSGQYADLNGREGRVARKQRDARIGVANLRPEDPKFLFITPAKYLDVVGPADPLWFLNLPEIDGKVEVGFKEEGRDANGPFGPVYVTDVAKHEAWRKQTGQEDASVIDFEVGQMPPGEYDLGWQSYKTALLIAKRYGVTLGEF